MLLVFNYCLLYILYRYHLLNMLVPYIHLKKLLLYLLELYTYMYLPVDNLLYYTFIHPYPPHLTYCILYNYYTLLIHLLHFTLHPYSRYNMFLLMLRLMMVYNLLYLKLLYKLELSYFLYNMLLPLLNLYMFLLMSDLLILMLMFIISLMLALYYP